MVDFGKKLLEKRVDGWEEYYIDYGRLKSLIKKASKAKKRKKEQQHNVQVQQRQQLGGRQRSNSDAVGYNYNFNGLTRNNSSSSSNNDVGSQSTGLIDRMTQMSPSMRGGRLFINENNEFEDDRKSIHDTVSDEYVTVLEFRSVLDYEIQKIVLFILTREGQLAQNLYTLSKDGQLLKTKILSLVYDYRQREGRIVNESDKLNAWNHLKESTHSHRNFASNLLQFVNFIDMNVTGLRKILKKHDKNFPHHQLSGTYLQQGGVGGGNSKNQKRGRGLVRDNSNNNNQRDLDDDSYDQIDSHLDKLYHFGGLSALVLTLRRAFDELHLLELNLLTLSDAAKNATQHRNHRRNMSTPLNITSLSSSGYGSIDNYNKNDNSTTTGGESDDDDIDGIISPIRAYKETPTIDNRKLPSFPGQPPIPSSSSSSQVQATPSSSYSSRIPPKPTPHRRMPTEGGGVNIDHSSTHVLVVESGNGGGTPAINDFDALSPRTSTTHRPRHLLKTTITRGREPILDQINEARSRLRQTTKYAELVAARALIFCDDDDDKNKIPDSKKTPASKFTTVQKISSMLNLWSTFLYMTNYYIVAPTVGDYALRLGSNESMSGIIIGMTPNAALVATVLYGFWSNYSYRNALIFASCSCVVGNILYALALYNHSITMVLLGRFLIGFGSARSINRRYIADVFSKADRTAASADFVTYAAFGMAAGPAAAFGLGHVSFDEDSLLWSNVNAPGWIMLFAWIVFLVVFIFYFQEPDRAADVVGTGTPEKMELTVTKTNSNNSLTSNISLNNNETEPLLIQIGGDTNNDGTNSVSTVGEVKKKTKDEIPLYKNVAVMTSLWMYFVLKLTLEMLLSSTGTVTKYYFSWDSKMSGLFMAVVALLMFPVNLVVSRLSQQYEDRELIAAALVVMLISVLGIIDYVPNYSKYQYIIFAIGIFISTNSLEGINMSLLSKTIPKSWAKGTFNSGFLATEAGTLARSVGDALISTVAGMFGMDMILNGLFTPMAVLCALTLLIVYVFYNQMEEMDDDDDDDTDSVVSNESGRSKESKYSR